MIEDVKAKLEDETMDVEGPGDENDPNNPFNRRGEKRGKRGKCKVVSTFKYSSIIKIRERTYDTPIPDVFLIRINIYISHFRHLKTLSFSKFWEKEPLAK